MKFTLLLNHDMHLTARVLKVKNSLTLVHIYALRCGETNRKCLTHTNIKVRKLTLNHSVESFLTPYYPQLATRPSKPEF